MAGHTDVVARVKADLEQRGVNLSGPCGAFELLHRSLWEVRAEGWGFIAAPPGGENCHGYRTDKAVRPGGTFVDCIGDAGGANTPQWDARPASPEEVAAFRPLMEPGPLPAPATPPAPEPPAMNEDPIPAPSPAPPAPEPEPGDPPFVELLAELKAIEVKLLDVAAGDTHVANALEHLQTTIDRLAVTGIRLHF